MAALAGALGCRAEEGTVSPRPNPASLASCPERTTGEWVELELVSWRFSEDADRVRIEAVVRADRDFHGPKGSFRLLEVGPDGDALPPGSCAEVPGRDPGFRYPAVTVISTSLWASGRPKKVETKTGWWVPEIPVGMFGLGVPRAGRRWIRIEFVSVGAGDGLGCESTGEPVDLYELTVFDGWVQIGEDGELVDWGERSTSQGGGVAEGEE